MLRNSIRTRKDARVLTKLSDIGCNGFGIHAVFVAQLLSAIYSAQNNAISECQSLRQRVLEDFAAHRIGTRLENRPHPPSWPARPCRLNRSLHGCGMVRKIVHDQDAANLAFYVHSTLHAAKCGQGL